MLCHMCGNQFHDQRPRCPACGTEPKSRPRAFNAPRLDACVLCQQGGRLVRCGTCGQQVHKNCLPSHHRMAHPPILKTSGVMSGRFIASPTNVREIDSPRAKWNALFPGGSR